MKAQKIVEIPVDEFEKMAEALEQCKKDKEKLEVANRFLNEQIKEYNKKFAKNENED